jgi:hypothetical protein
VADGLVEGKPLDAASGGDGGGDGTRPPRFGEFLRTRNGLLIIFAILAGVALALALALNFSRAWGLDLIEAPFLTSIDAWSWFATATCLLWLPLLLLLLDPQDNMATGPGLTLPLTTLSLLAILAAASVVLAAAKQGSIPALKFLEGVANSPSVLLAFFGLFSIGFVGRMWNAGLFVSYQQRDQRQRILSQAEEDMRSPEEALRSQAELDRYNKEHGDAEALGALLATLVVGAIIAGAIYIGDLNDGDKLDRGIGVGITFTVIGVFAAIVFQDWISGLPWLKAPVRALNGSIRRFAFLSTIYNFIDDGLVRIGAHAAGVGHLRWETRYAILGGTLLCLVVMAWFLPEPWGLIPAAVGFVLALSVSRLWSWVEEDRNIASITRFDPSAPIRVGFREDFRDEALLGFIFVFLLIPIAMKQADLGLFSGGLYTADAGNPTKLDPLTWLSFFGLELAKALPIVDWADIYLDHGLAGSLRAETVEARHFTFAARALVDLVLVAALLQAVSVSARNRQQKTLYAAGKIARFDEILEQKELARSVRIGPTDWYNHPVDFRHYDEDRLKELYSGSDDEARKGFIKTIFDQAGKHVDPAIRVLEELAKNQAPIDELMQTLESVKAEHASSEHKAGAFDFLDVLGGLRAKDGIKAFKFAVIDFAKKVGSPTSFAQLAEQVIYDARRDQMTYTRQHMARALTQVVPDLNDPLHVAELLAKQMAARREILGEGKAAEKIARDLETALKTRLREIGPPSIDN